jgi:carbamoyltransferase
MKQYYMGINLGHERSVAIVQEGEIIVAIEQERLDRHKYSVGFTLQAPGVPSKIQIPNESIRYCLDTCGITLTELKAIVPNMPGEDFAPDIVKNAFPQEIARRVMPIKSHHLAHAYSAFWPSGFEEALVLVVDATGNTTPDHRTESYTLYEGRGQTLKVLHSEAVASHLAGLSTLGFIYEYITRKAGFVSQVGNNSAITHPEAGKLMGLAPFGRQQPHWHSWIRAVENSYSLEISAYDIFLEVAALEKRYDTGLGKPYLRPYLVDLAYKVQQELEQALLYLVSLAIRETGLRKLCIAGGIGLNSVANYKLLKHLNLEDIFIFPASGDSGIAAGCALWAYHTLGEGLARPKLKRANLGQQYSQKQVHKALQQFSAAIEIEELSQAEMLARSAQKLAQGHIIARFEGGSEYGPRALGQRSIMVDPTFNKMKEVLNARVKFREAFRPFAPVVPLENANQIFDLEVAAPFMLVVPPIKAGYKEQLPAITHIDGTGRVQTVTDEDNPYFYQLCWRLAQLRAGPPVLLNTSFNVAGQPIVETPTEAIHTFLQTDIDYLAIENFWVSKRHLPVQNYEEHLDKLIDGPIPQGLPPNTPAVTDLMAQLDRALFWGETKGCPWSEEELQALSAEGARYKETSVLFPDAPVPIRSKLSDKVVLLLDPQGKSTLVDLSEKQPPSSYTYEEIKLLLSLLELDDNWQEEMRFKLRLTHAEFSERLDWAEEELRRYHIKLKPTYRQIWPLDSTLPLGSVQTLAPFADKSFLAYNALQDLRDCLIRYDYSETNICALLKVSSLQQIEPTYFYYYDRYQLPQTPIGDLIRLFLLRASVSQNNVRNIFGDELFLTLVTLGVLINTDDLWKSQCDLFCAEGLYFATDHRYIMQTEDKLDEEPVMYVGLDSIGLVHTAPRFPTNRVLDLCCGSGIQGLVASRYAKEVIGVDITPRAIRFARFNAQLNGVQNISFLQGNLYEAVKGQRFDTILANPPFVPSPKRQIRFRDGGTTGEEILERIIKDSATYLTEEGKLFIVSDLVNVQTYESKLARWWRGNPAHKLVFCTADRDDILFAIPHSRAAFGQSFQQYNVELDQWLHNFRAAGLKTVNFGYILIYTLPTQQQGSYYLRTIHNPGRPIHEQVLNYFRQRKLLERADNNNLFLLLSDEMHFRVEKNILGENSKIELFSPNNPYFTTYQISEQVYQLLQDIQRLQPQWQLFMTPSNRAVLVDLIYKGILYLSAERPKLARSRHTENVTYTDNLSIVELNTKTTPTCLSAYLNG